MKWKDINMIVTSGASFISSHLVYELLNLGANVTVIDNLSSGKLENLSESIEKIRFIKEDLEYIKRDRINVFFNTTSSKK